MAAKAHVRPLAVEIAILAGNTAALSAMGRAGARKRNAIRAALAESNERDAELAHMRVLDEEWERMQSTNEHIIPPPSAYD